MKISVKACDFVFAWMPGVINLDLREKSKVCKYEAGTYPMAVANSLMRNRAVLAVHNTDADSLSFETLP